jgi:hypothetical protein
VIRSFTTDVKVIARAPPSRHMEPTRDEIAVEGLKFFARSLAGAVDHFAGAGAGRW